MWCKLHLLGQLPDTFSAAGYMRVRQAEGFDCDNATTVNCALNQWVYWGYIVRTDTDGKNNNSKIYRKVKTD